VRQLPVFENFPEIRAGLGTWACGLMVAAAAIGVHSSSNSQIKAQFRP
jgi:hypothetical protein